MSGTAAQPVGHCTVANAAVLPNDVAGGDAICHEIERAIAAAAPTARYSAHVKVLSPSRLSAILVVSGRTLPEQNFAVMDRDLNAASIKRFAQALAGEVAKAAKE